jgi:hypothetical protein
LLGSGVESASSTGNSNPNIAIHSWASRECVCSRKGGVSTWSQARSRNGCISGALDAQEDIALTDIFEAALLVLAVATAATTRGEDLDGNVDAVDALWTDSDLLRHGGRDIVGVENHEGRVSTKCIWLAVLAVNKDRLRIAWLPVLKTTTELFQARVLDWLRREADWWWWRQLWACWASASISINTLVVHFQCEV